MYHYIIAAMSAARHNRPKLPAPRTPPVSDKQFAIVAGFATAAILLAAVIAFATH